jgi:hypothetical protein
MTATNLDNCPMARAMDHAFGLGHSLGLGHALGHDQYLSTRTHALVAARAYDHARQAVARRVPVEPDAVPAEHAVDAPGAPVANGVATETAAASVVASVAATAPAVQPAPAPGRALLPPWRGLLALL